MADFNFGANTEEEITALPPVGQFTYPLDKSSSDVLKEATKEFLPELNRVQGLTLKSGDVTFEVRNSDIMDVSSPAAVSITTITNSYNGQILTLLFNDTNVTIVHDATGTRNTVNLGGSNFTSTANSTLDLVNDGISWYVKTIGVLSATVGTIGGFSVGSDYIRDSANSMGLASTVTGGDDVRFWAGDTFANRATAPFRVLESGAVTMTSATISGVALTTDLKFGGSGADGAKTISSGTTTTSLAAAKVTIFNFTSISITGTGTQAYSNPHANGSVVVLKSQGAVTLTSSSAPMLDMSAMGAAGAPAPAGDGTAGSDGTSNTSSARGGSGGTQSGGSDTPGAGGGSPLYSQLVLVGKSFPLLVGAGGGAGAESDGAIDGGAGGRGGGAIYCECKGAFNFTTTSGISVGGGVGGNGTNGGASGGGAGGGGGGAGTFVLLYGALTANSGTVTVTGGTGGTGGTGSGGAGGNGGGGGGSAATIGSTGSANSGANGGAGGTGGTGFSLIESNTDFT